MKFWTDRNSFDSGYKSRKANHISSTNGVSFMERLACLLILVLSLSSQLSGASDVNTIDSIINTYYAVISGPAGFKYDADRDKNLHAEGAIITRFDENGVFQRHDLFEEQKSLTEPYSAGIFEVELSRRTEEFGNIAHVWSTFEMRRAPESGAFMRGVNSISLYFKEGRWWIASWSTQYEGTE
jgi:hypothetical protein